jgi:hypothetical protein
VIHCYDVGSMRALVIVFALGCAPPPDPVYVAQPEPAYADPDTEPPAPVAAPPIDQARRGTVVNRLTDFAFDGGWI